MKKSYYPGLDKALSGSCWDLDVEVTDETLSLP